MSTNVTISLPDELYQHVETLARRTHRPVAQLLAETIASALPARDQGAAPRVMADLSDDELLALTELQLPSHQDQQLSRLLEQQELGALAPAERAELLACMQMCQQGLLLKAQALNDAVRRGLIPPLEP